MSERRAPSKLRDRPTATSLSFAGSQNAGTVAEPRAIASGCRHSTRPLNVGTARSSKPVVADGYLIVVRRFSDRGHYCRTASYSERILDLTHLPCRTASDSERMLDSIHRSTSLNPAARLGHT